MEQKPIIPMSDHSEAIRLEVIRPTILPDAFLTSKDVHTALQFDMPFYRDLPDMPLYREQVISYIERVLSPLGLPSSGPWVTPSMINNYVKLGLVAAPFKKQYDRTHIARLLVICLFKQVLSIAAIQQLFQIQLMTYPDEIAYDYTAHEVTEAIRCAFSNPPRASVDTAQQVTRESLLVRTAAHAFASKTFLMRYLSYSGLPTE